VNRRSVLHFVAVAGVLAVSLLSSKNLFLIARQPLPADGDTLYLHRFDALKGALPRRGVVCYAPSPEISFETKKHYFLAQYAVAPVVLRTGKDCDLLISDFPGGPPQAVSTDGGWTVSRDFGNGLLLLERSGRP